MQYPIKFKTPKQFPAHNFHVFNHQVARKRLVDLFSYLNEDWIRHIGVVGKCLLLLKNMTIRSTVYSCTFFKEINRGFFMSLWSSSWPLCLEPFLYRRVSGLSFFTPVLSDKRMFGQLVNFFDKNMLFCTYYRFCKFYSVCISHKSRIWWQASV